MKNLLLDNALRKSKPKNETLTLNQILKKHNSQDVYLKPKNATDKKPKFLLTEKVTHSKDMLSKKINSISPRVVSPKQRQMIKSNKMSPRQNEKEHCQFEALDKIMSDNDSCQEIESEEEEDNCNAIDETEVSDTNNELKPNQKISNIKYHINKFPTLSSNPFMNNDLTQSQEKKEEDSEQLYRNLLILSKKGDRESFLGALDKVLLLPHSDINYRDESGFTALHYACDEGNLKIVDILLKANCDVNARTNDKKTPLHLTTSHGYFDLSKMLIENGAVLNIGDNEKNTPLHLSVMGGYVELTKFLLDKLPKADTKNIYAKTPLDLATKEEIKEILQNYLNKKENMYHYIKIHTASESTVNNMIKKLNVGTTGSKIQFQNTQNNININIQTNMNNNESKHNCNRNISIGRKKSNVVNVSTSCNLKKNNIVNNNTPLLIDNLILYIVFLPFRPLASRLL